MSVYDRSEWNRTSILLVVLATTNWERSPQYLKGDNTKTDRCSAIDQHCAALLPSLHAPSPQGVTPHTQLRQQGAERGSNSSTRRWTLRAAHGS